MQYLGRLLLVSLLVILPALAQSDAWMSHLLNDLMPFWNSPTALGEPIGAFPTTRCNDGSSLDFQRPCREVAQNSWLLTPQRTLVALSRQTYAYGVLFHITGNPGFLAYMKAGVDYIRANAIDHERGGLYTTQDLRTGQWGPRMELRNPQELAYGLLGMSFYYYLTRDPALVPDIQAVKEHIFHNYFDSNLGAMKWQLEDGNGALANEKRLVATLDQMNAYMVLLSPILPEPQRTEWLDDLQKLSQVMIDTYWSPSERLMFLTANKPADVNLAYAGTDFGHTIKALWMIRNTGLLTGREDLIRFAEDNGIQVIDRAFLAETGAWAQGVLAGGVLDLNKTWWIHAELDQFSASVGLQDSYFSRHLPQTQQYWMQYFVDHDFGEVWNSLDAKTNRPPAGDLPKQWPWKNGYHSLEHALVGYITARAVEGQTVPLYFAFQTEPDPAQVHPYFYRGEIDHTSTWTDEAGRLIYEVHFRRVH